MPLRPRPHTLRWLEQEIPAWQREGLLSPESAAALRTRYPSPANHTYQLGTVFISAFAACLIGAGIISLFAYNWNELGRPARTVLSLLPLLITQALAFWTLACRRSSAAVRESVCGGLILAIGAAISLIAQTYQISGDFAQFMLTWFCLALPAVYLLRSGLGYWLCQAALIVWGGYAQFHDAKTLEWYPLFFAASIPYYFWIRSRSDQSLQAVLNKWALALAAPIGLGLWLSCVPGDAWDFLFTAYFAASLLFDQRSGQLRERPFALIGALSLSVLLLVLSQYSDWGDSNPLANNWRIGIGIVLGLGWLSAITCAVRNRRYWLLPLGLIPLIVLIVQLITTGYATPEAADSANNTAPLLPGVVLTLYTLAVGILVLVAGIRVRRLLVLNLGLVLLGALAVLKFFDSDLGLMIKGTAFILVGCLFLIANLVTVRRIRKGNLHA